MIKNYNIDICTRTSDVVLYISGSFRIRFYNMILFLLAAYLLSTTEEWFLHKYIMHNKNCGEMYQNHIAHHKNTLKDLTITNKEDAYICIDLSSVNDVFQVIMLLLFNAGMLGLVFYPSISIVTISGTVAGFLTINILTWNTYHAYIHNLDSSEICDFPKGLPINSVDGELLYTNWVIRNHRIHHQTGGNCNYNIVFPGADYLFGTNK